MSALYQVEHIIQRLTLLGKTLDLKEALGNKQLTCIDTFFYSPFVSWPWCGVKNVPSPSLSVAYNKCADNLFKLVTAAGLWVSLWKDSISPKDVT